MTMTIGSEWTRIITAEYGNKEKRLLTFMPEQCSKANKSKDQRSNSKVNNASTEK